MLRPSAAAVPRRRTLHGAFVSAARACACRDCAPRKPLAPGATARIGLAFDGTGLAEGTYTANLVVKTNAISGGTTTIPVAFTIGGQGVVSGGPGGRLLAAPATGVTVDDPAAANLVQGVPGY